MRTIVELANEITKTYGGGNIFETAENMGIKVWFRRLGSLKGFYICENGLRYIVINEDLDERTKIVVCAHELGHDLLHKELSDGKIRDATLFLENSKTEREANLFAAEILIADSEILSELENNSSLDCIAVKLGFPREMVLYKLEALNCKGCDFNCGLNIDEIKNDFLKDD